MEGEGVRGKRIDDYVFSYDDFLGSGNFSKCYRATHTKTNCQVAIKIVELNSLKSKKLEELLFTEIEILKEMNHPNVLKCQEVFTSKTNCYIITELCNQGDLETKLRSTPTLSFQEIQNIVADVYKGLRYLDAKRIIHRDLKIANIFINNGLYKIADFGFALHCNSNFKDLNIGSPLYMAPEGILENIYGPKTDVWSFGIMIYELYHGRTPFHNCKTQLDLQNGVLRPIQPHHFRSDLPQGVQQLVIDCMQIKEAKRSSVPELIKHQFLRRIVHEREVELNGQLKLRNTNQPTLKARVSTKEQHPQQNSHQLRQAYSVTKGLNRKHPKENSPRKTFFYFKMSFNNYIQQSHNKSNNTPVQHNSTSAQHNNSLTQRNSTILKHSCNTRTNPQISNQSFSFPQKQGNSSSPINSPLMLASQPQSQFQQPELKNKLLIDGKITFKESIALLHYCRMLFKYQHCFREVTGLSKQRDREHYSMLGNFLLRCLEEICHEVAERQVIYEGQQAQVQEKKLEEVANEYHQRYKKELDEKCLREKIPEVSLQTVAESCYSMHASLWVHKESNQLNVIVAELLLNIYSSSLKLLDCFQKQSYAALNNDNAIEEVLSKSKEEFNFENYSSCRDKLLSRAL